MQCEMCGKDVSSLKVVLIEGVKMNVCSSCSRYGKVQEKKTFFRRKKISRNDVFEKEDFSLVPNYGSLIKRKRESLNIKQEDLAKMLAEKASVIHKIESNSPIISQKLAKTLESKLGVKIIAEPFSKSLNIEHKKDQSLTLGDMIKIKRRSKK